MILTDVFEWWVTQMRDLVPPQLRALFGRGRRRELVAAAETADAAELVLSLRGRGGETALGRQPLGGRALQTAVGRLSRAQRKAAVLRMPETLLLEQEIALPMTAESDMQHVLAYEMDRLTPFRADQVFWTWQGGARDLARKRLTVRLSLIPRRQAEPFLTALRHAGLTPTGVEAGNGSGRRVIPLAGDGTSRRWLGPRAVGIAWGACGALALAAIAMPFVQQSLALSALDARIEALKPQAAQVEALRRQIAGGAATADVVDQARKQTGSSLQALAVLTEVLPDDTYVTTLGLRQRKLTVSGRSMSAARLIGAMAANPLIHSPAFVAPVVRDETKGDQMFSIRADLGP
ncbi:MAG TPA: PilN domain-containing protein [Acetobacteraceae bacterium]|nr:PilN domain-containing protein [Acetobacteraceae bacterium]